MYVKLTLLYNYFIPFCATVKTITRGDVVDLMSLLHEAKGRGQQ